ncbi:serine/Arginine-related protein 53 isoform X1 [Xiphophorus maculatus]|uniref:serine/Arginine-related protein 53 isoform X1 n=1 Tax=Xiphophorus maculatus TaxID=8083 RepID=UPI000C6EA0F1|nr:serine/Arginine-related protein 53 isoform X1 [Xiphophorus maculatus]
MGRRSSDSEDDSRSRRKRKQRRRSSSSSSSSSSGSRVRSSRSRRSTRRSRSRSKDRRRRRRSSSSSSQSSSRRRRSRSADRDKGRSHRSHRSRSRERRSHSHHRRSRSRSNSRGHRTSHSRKRSRSNSRERDRSRRKGRDRDREKDRERDRGRDRDKDKSKDKKGDSGSIKDKLEHLTPAEQAKVRMHLVLQAAAKTDEVLKAKVAKREEEARKKLEEEGTSLEEQVRRIKDIEAIESDSFVPQAFKSSRDDTKFLRGVLVYALDNHEVYNLPHDCVGFNMVVAAQKKQESESAPSQDYSLPMSIVYDDSGTLAHPSLFMDKERAEDLWLSRLISLRQERLMGSPVA